MGDLDRLIESFPKFSSRYCQSSSNSTRDIGRKLVLRGSYLSLKSIFISNTLWSGNSFDASSLKASCKSLFSTGICSSIVSLVTFDTSITYTSAPFLDKQKTAADTIACFGAVRTTYFGISWDVFDIDGWNPSPSAGLVW